MVKYGILFFALLIFSCSAQKGNQEIIALGPKEFRQKMESTKNGVLIDVRTLEEVQQERIKGEVNFDYNAPGFVTLIKGLDKTKSYFLYCGSGVRSSKAADKMREEGFTKIYTLEGGIKAWKAEGLPIQN